MSIAVVAHRGASGVTGEDNTLRSFARAIDLGCPYVETDLRRTRDGVVVCFHDAEAGGTAVGRLTHVELCAASGSEVPTLAAAAAFCAGRIALDLELKETGYEADILRLVSAQAGLKAVYKSFQAPAVLAVKARDRSACTGWLAGRPPDAAGEPDADRLLERVCGIGADFLAPHRAWAATGLFERAAARGVPVWVWTVDDPEEMHRLRARPVAALVTNRPDLALEVLRVPPRTHSDARVRGRARNPDSAGFAAFLARSAVDGVPVHTRQVRMAPGAIDELPAWCAALFGGGARIAVVMDAQTRATAGERVLGRLSCAVPVELAPLEGWPRITPHDDLVRRTGAAMVDCDAAIAVGSGTINDIVKYASTRAGKPYIAIPTAASMNGYTSSIAALIVGGLKSTLPSQPPVLVLAEPGILATAPAAMGRSGYADLLGKSVATADWKMASIVGAETYRDLPGVLVDDAIDQCVARAAGIGAGEPAAMETLLTALVLSGFAMTLAGSSAPASGGEHLISHLWDMIAYGEGRLPELHGLQVGIGALMTAGLYEFLRESDPASFAPGQPEEDTQRRAHGALWPSIEAEARKQRLAPEEADRRVGRIRACWPEIWRSVDVPSFDGIRERLLRAGAPATLAGLGVSRERARHTFLHAADIRARYTVLHLARDIGRLAPGVDRVLERL